MPRVTWEMWFEENPEDTYEVISASTIQLAVSMFFDQADEEMVIICVKDKGLTRRFSAEKVTQIRELGAD